MNNILEINNRHKGKTIYIIGNSDELFYISSEEKKELDSELYAIKKLRG